MARARLVEVEVGDERLPVLVVPARCGAGRCFLLAYRWRGARRLLVVPAQPSPACVRVRLGEEERRVVAEALAMGAGAQMPGYFVPVCGVAASLLSDDLGEVLERLKALGVVSELFG